MVPLSDSLSYSGKTRKDRIIEYTAVSCPKALDFTEIVVRSTGQDFHLTLYIAPEICLEVYLFNFTNSFVCL